MYGNGYQSLWARVKVTRQWWQIALVLQVAFTRVNFLQSCHCMDLPPASATDVYFRYSNLERITQRNNLHNAVFRTLQATKLNLEQTTSGQCKAYADLGLLAEMAVTRGPRSSVMVKVKCYKPEGRGFDTRWGEFLNLPNPSALAPGVYWVSNRNEYQKY
jgi:hypothetical protein